MIDDNDSQWQVLLRTGELNRGGAPDLRHSITPTAQDLLSIDVSHSRVFSFGVLEASAGFEQIDDLATATSSNSSRFYLQWRSSY